MINTIYITPHPPIVVPEVGKGEEEKIGATLESFKKMAREIANLKPETIIISSPHQLAYIDGFYIGNSKKAYGDLIDFRADVKLQKNYDRELANLIAEDFSNISHLEEDYIAIDHGALVPLYFIEREYSDYELVLIGISGLDSKEHYKLGKKIEKAVEESGRHVVMIASGDLSHVLKSDGPYGYKKEGEIFDKKIIEILEKPDFKSLLNFDEDLIEDAAQCGIKSFQIMAGVFDGYEVSSKKWSYENDFGVGYGFFKLTRGEKRTMNNYFKSDDIYINLAKSAIDEYVKTGVKISTKDVPNEITKRKAAAFVTIYEDESLRGCIGTILPSYDNLAEEIIENAISAATKDPRFSPVTKEELDNLVINVDILSEMEHITSLKELDPKRYGVVVGSVKDNRRGLLLPDLEGIESVNQQLSIAFSKAGMDKDEPYHLWRFEVERHE